MGISPRTSDLVRVVGRYALHGPIAAGGMATVHFGRLLGPVGFSRTVAIKRLHAQYAQDPEFVSMFLDEARLAARIRHPNVVPTLDVVATEGELFLVMEYVPGESLARLTRGQERAALRIISAVMASSLHGLHAAHEARDERGLPLGIVHRDVSPQNILVGTDGVPRVLDFGVAKASGRVQHTREGQIKGKLSYMPPEQLRGAVVTRQADIYAAGVILWELLTGQRLFAGDNEGVVVAKILEGVVPPPSRILASSKRIDPGEAQRLEVLDRIVLRALDSNPLARYATAREMAVELERALPPATATEIGEWVEVVARDVLASRAGKIAEIESSQTHNFADLMAASGQSGLMAQIPPSTSGGVPRAIVDMSPPVTQPSSISVSTTGRPRDDLPTANTRTILAAAGGLLLALFLVLGMVLVKVLRGHPDDLAGQPQEPPFLLDAGAVMSQPLTPPTQNEPPPSAVTSEARDAGASTALEGAPPSVHPTTPARPSNGGGSRPHPATTTTPPRPPATDCSPPFTFEGGIKKYKPGCI